ncbi:MAG: PDZ domain-containing protein [Geobacteraceae bacterium]|nr:PDZ domain-containing protein [Geobacteraceae bacterium]
MKKFTMLFLLFMTACSQTDHYINSSGDIRTCNASWHEGIGHIQAKSYLRDCKRTQIATGYIPINLDVGHTGIFPNSEFTEKMGFKIDLIIKNSPADKAGITAGDYILKVNDNLIDDYPELLNAVGGDDSKQVKLETIKNGNVESYELKKRMIEKYNLR